MMQCVRCDVYVCICVWKEEGGVDDMHCIYAMHARDSEINSLERRSSDMEHGCAKNGFVKFVFENIYG